MAHLILGPKPLGAKGERWGAIPNPVGAREQPGVRSPRPSLAAASDGASRPIAAEFWILRYRTC
jgi:hypothetical protein